MILSKGTKCKFIRYSISGLNKSPKQKYDRPRSSYISLKKKRQKKLKKNSHLTGDVKSIVTQAADKHKAEKNKNLILHSHSLRTKPQEVKFADDPVFHHRDQKSNLKHYINVLTNHRKSSQYFVEDQKPQATMDEADKNLNIDKSVAAVIFVV